MPKIEYNEAPRSLPSIDESSMAMDQHKCRKCRQWRQLNAFYFRNNKPDRVCKDCKKSAQKDHYRRKSLDLKLDVILGNVLNKILDYKILRFRLVNEELERLVRECEETLQRNPATI
ncbi:MAG: hypothetical protein AB7T49_06620 [Oligoflexales bacterium]